MKNLPSVRFLSAVIAFVFFSSNISFAQGIEVLKNSTDTRIPEIAATKAANTFTQTATGTGTGTSTQTKNAAPTSQDFLSKNQGIQVSDQKAASENPIP